MEGIKLPESLLIYLVRKAAEHCQNLEMFIKSQDDQWILYHFEQLQELVKKIGEHIL